MSYWILPFTFQLVLQSIVLFPVSLIFGKPVGFKEGILIVEWWRWFDDRWPFTTCIAYIFAGSPAAEVQPGTWFHEVGVHVKQFEDLAVLGDVLALVVYLMTGDWVAALVIWGTAGPLWMLPWLLTALRHRKAGKELGWRLWRTMYMFSWHEKDAYAETAVWRRNGGGR